ncbi:hypothetical protein PR202_gb08024 [Eleusine coracana subsp. coracana]|uniref:Secreted protein n=1 Tax=Eleusine coracana subsp. coracana TaxID=191504 RepID=A0AAV5EB67_ELECO|nr:hypothetical protein PR202_gb08024 [Eleusine coracana subsp. coracana]
MKTRTHLLALADAAASSTATNARGPTHLLQGDCDDVADMNLVRIKGTRTSKLRSSQSSCTRTRGARLLQ